MRSILFSLLASSCIYAQSLGWHDQGANTVLSTAATVTGTGSLVSCTPGLKPYCTGTTANYDFLGHVKSVIQAQSTCAQDQVHNIAICNGGGHTDYWGNQIYLWDIVNSTVTRVTDPSGNVNNSGQVNPDGTGPAVHSQQGLTYMPSQDCFFRWGIGVGNTALQQTVGWWLCGHSPPITWVQKSNLPTRTGDGGENVVLDTSASTEQLIILNWLSNTIYRYTTATDTYATMANAGNIFMINGGTCAVAGTTKTLYCAGLKEQGGGGPAGGVYTYDLNSGSSYLATDITSTLTNCGGLYSISNPGFKWDSDTSKFVGYTGTGDSVTVFDPVALSCTTVTYSGGPTAAVADTYGIYDLWEYFPSLHSFAVLSNADTHAFTLNLDPIAPTITSSTPLPAGTQNSAYTFTFTASGTAPMTWSITAGAPPTGVSLNSSTGILSGTPTTYGTFTFTISASNGYGSPSTQNASLTINPVCLITAAGVMPAGKLGIPYSQTVPTQGCSHPTFTVNSGSLPTGLSFTGSSGLISGTPTVPGLSTFTIGVTDTNGNPSQSMNLTIIPGPGIMLPVTATPHILVR